MIRLAAIIFMIVSPALALKCENDFFEGTSFSRCEVLLGQDDIRFFLRDHQGMVLGYFPSLKKYLVSQNLDLLFAMNAGMYRPDQNPAGLYIEENKVIRRLVTGSGPGNFGLLPNGVLCIAKNKANVYETQLFKKHAPICRFATQSGPMLVIDGALHPKFKANSKSKFIRNGVGTTLDGKKAFFVISNSPLNFHMFARYFKDHLKLNSALYLDGNISILYAPLINRRDLGRRLGPIIGVVGQRQEMYHRTIANSPNN